MAEQAIKCFRCGHNWTFTPPLGRASECPSCAADARACKNCQFFDAHAHKQCREPQADLVPEKDRSNFCGYFSASGKGGKGSSSDQTESRRQLDRIFGTTSSDESSANDKSSPLDKQFSDFLRKNKPGLS